MCNRYRTRVDKRKYQDAYGITSTDAFEELYEVFPKRSGPIIRVVDGGRHVSLARWAFVSHRDRSLKPKLQPNNARLETIATKYPFAPVFKRQRCLIPVDTFFEWHHPADGSKAQQYEIAPSDGGPIAMAGVWDTWQGPDGPLDGYAMITTTASPHLAKIHNKGKRMPLILRPEDYGVWLDPQCHDIKLLTSLGEQAPYVHARPELQ